VADERAQGGVDPEEAPVGADHGGGHRGGGQGAPDPLQLVAGPAVQPVRGRQGQGPEGPPADLAQGRHQPVGVDVLVQAGVRAPVQDGLAQRLAGEGGQGHHPGRRHPPAQLGDHGRAVGAGHAEVEHDHVGLGVGGQPEGLVAVAGLPDQLEAPSLEGRPSSLRSSGRSSASRTRIGAERCMEATW